MSPGNTTSMVRVAIALLSRTALAFIACAIVSRSALGQGSFTAPQPWPSVPVHQVHLPTDKILFWAYNGCSAWLWDVGTPLGFAEKPNMNANIFCSGHAGLANGNYLVAGGLFITSAQLFDLSTPPGNWVTLAPMTATRFYPTCTTLGDGKIIAISGSGSGADIPEVYDPATNTWTQLTGAQLSLPLYPFMFLLPDGKLFFAGPSTVSGILDIPSQTWTIGPTSANDGASAVMYGPGLVMKCGGFAAATATTETIDMTAATPVWTTVGSMAFARHDHSLTILPDGTVLAAGGHDATNTAVLPAEIWDPQTGNWTTVASLTIPRLYHSTSMLIRDGRVVVGGGDGYSSVEIYSPPYLGAGRRPQITSAPAQITYGQAFTVKWTAFANLVKVTLIRLGAVTHSFDQNQRYLELAFQIVPPIGIDPATGAMTGTLSAQPPSGGNLAPPGDYMLFLVDAQGVPSVGRYVRLN
jgi:WD40 repeat protein